MGMVVSALALGCGGTGTVVFGLAFVFFFNRGMDFNFFVFDFFNFDFFAFDFFAIPVSLKSITLANQATVACVSSSFVAPPVRVLRRHGCLRLRSVLPAPA